MKIIGNTITLYHMNNTLSKRVKKHPQFYLWAIASYSLFWGLVIAISLFTNFVVYIDLYELQTFYNAILYLLVGMDLIFICMRFSGRTLIEPVNISLYPISIYKKTLLNVAVLLFDYRCIPYIVFCALIVAKPILHFQVLSTVVSTVLMLLLMVNVTIWMNILLYSTGQYFPNHRVNVAIIYALFILFYSAASNYKHCLLMNVVPITSYAGTALFHIGTGDVVQSMFYLGLLLGGVIAGYCVLILTYERQ